MERESNTSLRSSLLDHNNVNGSDQNPKYGGSATAILVFSSLTTVCGSYVFGAAGYSSPAETEIRDDLGLSITQYSIFGSTMVLGAMLGAGISGKIADLLGQKKVMGILEIICIIGWLAIAYSEKAWLLDLERVLIGFCVGLLSFIIPMYIAEITPKNLRGGFSALHQFILSVGTSLTYFIGAVIS